MAKIMPFSRFYPAYHPKAGQQTYFVEKYWASIGESYFDQLVQYDLNLSCHIFSPKHHTIRAGHRWKEGDMMSPRFWGTDINPKSGRSGPYHSKQIQFAPDTEVLKVYNFNIYNGEMYINNVISPINNQILAANDGLDFDDLLSWFKFPAPFAGQIICWNDAAQYFV